MFIKIIRLLHLASVALCFSIAAIYPINGGSTAYGNDFSALFARIDRSVVTIQTSEIVGNQKGIRQRQGIGSGVLIDATGLIMTSAHVVHSADYVQVKFVGGEVSAANVVTSVAGGDVALLKVGRVPDSAQMAKLGNSDKVKVGQEAIIIGAPMGVEHSLSLGHVSGKVTRRLVAGGAALQLIQTDAAVSRGNSGGPMFNSDGEVIGIVSHILRRSGGSNGIGFAVSINAAKKFLLDGSPFWTGFEGKRLTPMLARLLNVSQGSGLLVQRVLPGSMAGRAGLIGGKIKVSILGRDIWIGGDVILEIENVVCVAPHDFDEIRATLRTLKQGDAIHLKVLRAGKIVDIRMKM
jgi:serine protease Do